MNNSEFTPTAPKFNTPSEGIMFVKRLTNKGRGADVKQFEAYFSACAGALRLEEMRKDGATFKGLPDSPTQSDVAQAVGLSLAMYKRYLQVAKVDRTKVVEYVFDSQQGEKGLSLLGFLAFAKGESESAKPIHTLSTNTTEGKTASVKFYADGTCKLSKGLTKEDASKLVSQFALLLKAQASPKQAPKQAPKKASKKASK